jgi:hypothetical protein
MGRSRKIHLLLPASLLLIGVSVTLWIGSCEALAGPFKGCWGHGACAPPPGGPTYVEEWGGNWYWMRSPEEEKQFVASLYNRYCIRCHGVDGRGVWDIPGVPDFTDAHWHSFHSDGQLTRSILEGRGAVMPPFRGTLSLDEGWAMARYLRSFIPGTEVSRPPTGRAPAAK